MSDFDAARYTISVRKENTEDGIEFVARVGELPDLAIHCESATEAYAQAIDVIETSKEMFDEEGVEFPAPEQNVDREYSGRLPLRVPRTLHRTLVLSAECEGMSLNAYANYLLSQHAVLNQVLEAVECWLADNRP